jgi:uncharacterized phage-associated protein
VEITRDDFDTWKHDPVTREVFNILRERQEKIAHGLAMGGAVISPDNAVASGRYQEIEDLLTMSYDDMKPVKEE